MKRIYPIFYTILLIIIGIFCYDVFGWGNSAETIQISISENDNLSVLSDKLKEEKVIFSKHLFKLFYQFNTHSTTIHPGTVTLHKNDSYQQISKAISDSKKGTVTITIPEGFEVREIAERLLKNELISSENDFYTALENYSFQTNQGNIITGEALNGFLFPDTYAIPQSTTPKAIITMMTNHFNTKWTDEFQKKADALNMDVTEVITLASIVEREARKETDFPLVASVFHNRLQQGKKLESCATVQYILKERKAVLSVADTQIDSPYNTYRYEGLPPAPIAVPGMLAIEAVLSPANTDYLYFFTDKNGNNHYAKTYAEHNALINQYGL
ncbi:MAG: endolytic transglycosylase MltG [Clostridia bacterium]|nr:endolytic transglycosylase MltG [Clostridia bacterium]